MVTLSGAKDSLFKKKVLERLELALASQTFAASTTIETLMPAAMGAAATMNLGDVVTADIVYIEYTGANLLVTFTDGNGTSTLSLNSGTTERVILMEGMAITQIDVQNTDGSIAAPFHIAVFGAL